MVNILDRAFKYNKSILILGETGVGKSLMARNIHKNSLLSNLPFLELNISSISKNLFESELYGFVKSAFTGAEKNKIGFVERVGKGTLFIDEIGELPLTEQVKLLTFIETRKYFKVGSSTESTFEGRLIFATNKDLQKLVKSGDFREDLYFRISNFSKTLPPLRATIDDKTIQGVANEMNDEFEDYRVVSKCFVDEAKKYSWPGNYRELKSCLEYLYIADSNRRLSKHSFRNWLSTRGPSEKVEKITSFREKVNQSEKDLISKALARNIGKINQTSRDLRLNKTTLIAKIKKYDINTNHFSNLAQTG